MSLSLSFSFSTWLIRFKTVFLSLIKIDFHSNISAQCNISFSVFQRRRHHFVLFITFHIHLKFNFASWKRTLDCFRNKCWNFIFFLNKIRTKTKIKLPWTKTHKFSHGVSVDWVFFFTFFFHKGPIFQIKSNFKMQQIKNYQFWLFFYWETAKPIKMVNLIMKTENKIIINGPWKWYILFGTYDENNVKHNRVYRMILFFGSIPLFPIVLVLNEWYSKLETKVPISFVN